MGQQLFLDEAFRVQDSLSNPRKAALMLHSMSAEDRNWVLEQLPESQKDTLQLFLAELTELGIPVDPELLQDIMTLESNLPSHKAHGPEPTTLHDAIAVLENAEPVFLARLLYGEPTGLIVRFLRIHPWSWIDDFLAQLDVSKRYQVREQLDFSRSSDFGDVLDMRLIFGILARIEAAQRIDGNSDVNVCAADESSKKWNGRSWIQRLWLPGFLRNRLGVDR